MVNSLVPAVFRFFEHLLDESRPVLLGLSGGPDSTALYCLLKEYRRQPFAIAHIDHQWREESEAEAEALKKMAEYEGVPFHLKRLDPHLLSGNLEEACRRERYHFFKYLCGKFGYQGVILGHHADDQAESVLKRIFEGAGLTQLGGMKLASQVYGVPVFRPLLTHNKNEIICYLQQQGSTSFDDATNRDKRFLRARMREELIPLLAEKFGKNIVPPLHKLSEEAQELGDYLHTIAEEVIRGSIIRPNGLYLDLSEKIASHPFELKYLIRWACQQMGMTLSKEQLMTACHLIKEKSANKEICNAKEVLHIDRGRLFVLPEPLSQLPSAVELKPGSWHYGPWQVTVRQEAARREPLSSWLEAWKGRVSVSLPMEHSYTLGACNASQLYPGSNPISKIWTSYHVPAFLRSKVPVIYSNQGIVYEFLTGKDCFKVPDIVPSSWLHIVLEQFPNLQASKK